MVPRFPLLGLTPSGSFMGFTQHFNLHFRFNSLFHHCVYSATQHNIHMYPYFPFAAINHPKRPQLSLSDLVAQSAE